MPLEGLAKAKSLASPKMQTMNYGMWQVVAWEFN
jgi:hypothetical protein